MTTEYQLCFNCAH